MPTANTVPSGEELKAFPLKSETKQGYSLLPPSQHNVGSTRQSSQPRKKKKKIKSIQIGKKEVKLSLQMSRLCI